MRHGFIYVLSNITMPGMYKIGRTIYSPTKRAIELSRATGVPFPFGVVCYLEVDDCVAAETEIHNDLEGYRVSASREFFRAPIAEIVQCLRESGYRLSYCDVEVSVAAYDEQHEKSINEKATGFALY